MHDNEEVISIADSDDETHIDRRAILAPAIHSVIAALGGFEGATYQLGDEAYGCLKDLKKFWRKDDTDDERTVARIFWEARVLPKDLVPILLETAGKGKVGDKCAIACADLVTAMTWPIDMSEELKELDEEFDKGTDYTQLLQSHLAYKSALLQPGVIQALLGIMLPCLAKEKKERKERDGQIVNVVLHLFRNLAFIKDIAPNMHSSMEQAEYSSLQSKLIQTLSASHILNLLLTLANNASTDAFFNGWNTLILEIFYLLFRGVKPSSLSIDQTKRPQGNLSRLLEAEDKAQRTNARKASSRHSRFGTTISVKLNTTRSRAAHATANGEGAPPHDPDTAANAQMFVLHRQQALNKETGSILDMTKRKVKRKGNKLDELGREDNLSSEAMLIMQNLARSFIESCFNGFLSSLLKDIKSERPKITEKDNLRLLFVTKWFLEFFLATRTQEKDKLNSSALSTTPSWGFDLVAEVTERGWIVWVLKRMREAVEEKPKLWTELQAGIECLTQLLLLIDCMSSSHITDPALNEAAELLQQQLVYNGEVLDIAVESLRVYKEGVQSLTYLDSSVHMAYALLRMLERWAKAKGNGDVYVRKRAKSRKSRAKNKDLPDHEDVPDEDADMQDEETEKMIEETMFTFDAFEAKFAQEDITHTLMVYLARYNDFVSSDQMKRVVNLLHRQAVKAKAEGLFFKVSTLNLFKTILAQQRTLPRDQPYKDLITLINYILRKFFKAIDEEPLVIVEAFFPKNRGRWKQFSSWEPETKQKAKRDVDETGFPQDVQVKKGFSWSEQLGIAVACLVDAGQTKLVDWIKEILATVIGQRQRVVEEVDGSSSQLRLEDMGDDMNHGTINNLRGPSTEALAKFEDFLITCDSDEQANAATRNPQLKLIFRLIKCSVLDDNADELEWYIPAAILPSDLQGSLNVIIQFLDTPLDLGGKKASQLIRRKARRRRRAPPSEDESEADADDTDEEGSRKKRVKKIKEKEVYKSAQFIEDSDVEYGDDETFWAKERALRERNERLAAEGKAGTMRSTGTKKRKKKAGDGGSRKKRTLEDEDPLTESDSEKEELEPERMSSSPATTPPEGKDQLIKQYRPKPRPRPHFKTHADSFADSVSSHRDSPELDDNARIFAGSPSATKSHVTNHVLSDDSETERNKATARKGRARIIISDDEE